MDENEASISDAIWAAILVAGAVGLVCFSSYQFLSWAISLSW